MAMPPQFAKSKTPGKGMPPSKPGDNPFAKKGAAPPAKGKGKGANPFAKKGAAPGKAPAKGKAGVNPFAKKK